MAKKIRWEWEKLDEVTQRVKVIGGWIVIRLFASETTKNKIDFRESMVFIPDSDHQWTIAKEFNPSDPGTLHPKVNPSDFDSPK